MTTARGFKLYLEIGTRRATSGLSFGPSPAALLAGLIVQLGRARGMPPFIPCIRLRNTHLSIPEIQQRVNIWQKEELKHKRSVQLWKLANTPEPDVDFDVLPPQVILGPHFLKFDRISSTSVAGSIVSDLNLCLKVPPEISTLIVALSANDLTLKPLVDEFDRVRQLERTVDLIIVHTGGPNLEREREVLMLELVLMGDVVPLPEGGMTVRGLTGVFVENLVVFDEARGIPLASFLLHAP